MELIRSFAALNKSDSPVAGGKGASLGEMTQVGIPVPPGYVVLTDAFEAFLTESDLRQEIEATLAAVRHDEMHTVEHASEKIQAMILNAKMPASIREAIIEYFKNLDTQFVAVRSSATAEDGAEAAWAGQLDTFLNTTEENLLPNVQRCWASLFTPRAIFYRFEKGLHASHISVAVVVQKMVASEISGIAFSVHPVTEDFNQLIIEAGYGLGEAIVSGQVTPDSYVVTKSPRVIIDTNTATQSLGLYRAVGGGNKWQDIPEPKASAQVLTEAQILELSDLIVHIEKHYGFPCDIEWAFESGKFYITQSRPITTLGNTNAKKTSTPQFEKKYTRDFSAIMAEAWYLSLQRLVKEAGWGPFAQPFMIQYLHDGLVEYWENSVASEWLSEKLLQENTKNPDFFVTRMRNYEACLRDLEKYWSQKNATSREDFVKFIALLNEAYQGWNIMYFTAGNEKTPPDLLKIATEMRAKDTLGDNADSFIQLSLKYLYPEIAEESLMILSDEVLSPSFAELKERYGHFVIYIDDAKYTETVTLESFAQTHRLQIAKTTVTSTDQIKGATGCPGVVRGKVRILRKRSEIESLKDGEILVTAMTTPEYVPAMRRAAAVVTDEGGVTCHAAIFSREINKPCVIGTKFATEIFKDGDEVEVDADAGVVRRIQAAAKKGEYFQHYTQTEVGLLTVDTILQEGAFGDVPYFHLLENDELRGYLDQEGLAIARRIGEEIQDDQKFKTIQSDARKVLAKLKKYKVKKLTHKNVISEWDKFVQHWKEMWHVYRYSDEPFNRGNIDLLRKELSDEQITKIFENPKTVRVPATARKLVNKMLWLGHNRLDLHLHAEYIATTGYESFRDFISSQEDISMEDYLLLRIDEIAAVLVGGNIPREVIEIRKRGCVMYPSGSEFIVGTGKEYEAWKARIQGSMPEEIKGLVGYKGIVRGRVVKHMSWTSVTAVQEGEVLVTGMTNPQMVPYLKKAAAIVTDEGGMTCHAAILSREMKIPCIVGTQIATQKLQNGDLVEVNAETGIVTLITKAL